MRVRRTFNLSSLSRILGIDEKSKTVGTAVPIIYERKRHILDDCLGINQFEKSLTKGSLLNIRHLSTKSWWLDFTTSVQNETVNVNGTQNFKTSRTAFDDIVLAAGYNLEPTSNSQLIFYGLAGFPTKTKVSLLEARNTLVGTRFYSLGLGYEFSYNLVKTLKKAFILVFQNRFIHFFNRKWTPILPAASEIKPGNITDVLVAAQLRLNTDIVEIGYNGTFFTNAGVILPTGTIDANNYRRDSYFMNYRRVIKKTIKSRFPIIIGGGWSIGNTKVFDTKIHSVWVNLSVVF